jgi:hypothetical protein
VRDRIEADQNPVERIVARAIEVGVRGPQAGATGTQWRLMAQRLLDRVKVHVASTNQPEAGDPS